MTKRHLTDEDMQILKGYASVIKGFSLIYGSNCEVSLHSMEDLEHSIVAIENGFVTGREVGSGMIPLIKERLSDHLEDFSANNPESDVIGIFYSYNQNGHPLKSTVILIRNPQQVIIGCIGIHVDVSIPLHEFVKGFLPSVNGGMMDEFNEHVPNDTDQLIFSSLAEATTLANAMKGISSLERNRVIVKELNNRGIFNIRGSVETVAKQLGTSRYTIYNYLRDTKN